MCCKKLGLVLAVLALSSFSATGGATSAGSCENLIKDYTYSIITPPFDKISSFSLAQWCDVDVGITNKISGCCCNLKAKWDGSGITGTNYDSHCNTQSSQSTCTLSKAKLPPKTYQVMAYESVGGCQPKICFSKKNCADCTKPSDSNYCYQCTGKDYSCKDGIKNCGESGVDCGTDCITGNEGGEASEELDGSVLYSGQILSSSPGSYSWENTITKANFQNAKGEAVFAWADDLRNCDLVFYADDVKIDPFYNGYGAVVDSGVSHYGHRAKIPLGYLRDGSLKLKLTGNYGGCSTILRLNYSYYPSPGECSDGADNDKDCLVDCDDPDCTEKCHPSLITASGEKSRAPPCGNYGDANEDGVVTAADASAIAAYAQGKGTLSQQGSANANVTGDGTVDVVDSLQITQYLSGDRATFTACQPPAKSGTTSVQAAPASKAPPCGTYGDVNGDNVVTSADAENVSLYTVGQSQLSSKGLENADVDGDSKVLIMDAMFIAKYASGTANTFPVCQQCSGTPSITPSAIEITEGAGISAVIGGLSDCDNKEVSVRDNGCGGAKVGGCTVSGTGCTASQIKLAAGTHLLYACIDKNGDGTYAQGEIGIQTGMIEVAAAPSAPVPMDEGGYGVTATETPAIDPCAACGEGWSNICDRDECHGLGACVYTPPAADYDYYGTCASCPSSIQCSSFGKQKECEQHKCGFACAWKNDQCSPASISLISVGPTAVQSSTSVTLSAETDVPALCRWGYSTKSYESLQNSFAGSTTGHTAQITANEGENTVRIACKHPAANVYVSRDFTFTVNSPTSTPPLVTSSGTTKSLVSVPLAAGCASGQCTISGACYNIGQDNPSNPCQKCDLSNLNSWSNKACGASCSGGVCVSGSCQSTASKCADGCALVSSGSACPSGGSCMCAGASCTCRTVGSDGVTATVPLDVSHVPNLLTVSGVVLVADGREDCLAETCSLPDVEKCAQSGSWYYARFIPQEVPEGQKLDVQYVKHEGCADSDYTVGTISYILKG